MPVSSIITDSKFNCQFVNGTNFETNADVQFSPNLIGSVMERVKVRLKVSVSWSSVSSASNKYSYDSSGVTTIVTRQSGSWAADGVSFGDTFDFLIKKYESGSANGTSGVATVNDKTLVLTTNLGDYFDGQAFFSEFKFTNPLTSIYYKFGLIENNETSNYLSKVTDNEQGYYASGFGLDSGSGRDTTFVEMSALGDYQDWKTGSGRIRYVQSIGDYVQEFEIEHEFIINPFYTEDSLENLLNSDPIGLFRGFNTLKYIAGLDLRKSISQPSSSKLSVIDYVLGSTGWFNENFDGLNSNYEVITTSFIDDATSQPIDSLNITGKTNVTVVISKKNGDFAYNAKSGVYISHLPTFDDYVNKTTDFVYNFMYDNGFAISNNAPVDGGDYITNISSTHAAGVMTLTFDVEFSAAQIQKLTDSESKYIAIAIQQGDVFLDYQNSDRVMLLANVSELQEHIDIQGLVSSVDEFKIWNHPQDITADAGYTDMIGWNEDGLVSELQFSLDLSKSTLINTIEQKVIAYNETTGDYFELDSYNFPVENVAVVAGVQEINIDTTKGYQLAADDQFNIAKLETGARVGDIVPYTITTAQKITWQDWQAIAANSVFYDNSKPNNNLNRKASNYSDLSGYEIKIAYLLNLFGEDDLGRSGNTDYLIISPDVIVNDYELPASWTAEMTTWDPDTLSDLENQVLDNKNTLFRVTWSYTTPITDIANFWGVHRIEVTNQQGFQVYELSTLKEYPARNPLQPLDGELGLNIYIDNGNVVTECYINPSFIDVTNGVNLTGRLEGQGSGIPAGVKITEAGEYKVTESGEYKIIE